MEHNWDFVTILQKWRVHWVGLQGTLLIFGVTVVLCMPGAFIPGVFRYLKNTLVAWPARAFVEFFRNTPVLMQIVWFYHAFPILTDIDTSPFFAAVPGVSLSTMAFSAEIYRAPFNRSTRANGKPAFSSPTSVGMRREDDKTFRDWVDISLLYWCETGQIQTWYEEFLTEFGLDPKASPVVQRELLFGK